MPRILLVDDEETILRSLGVLLKSEGHEVVALKDPSLAAQALKTEEFDLLMTDIRMMPIDGMELIQIAHKEKPSLPVIIVSAYTSDKTQAQGYNAGCIAYVRKPFKVSDVIDALNKVFGPKG